MPDINPRLIELGEKQLAGTITPEEVAEMVRLKHPADHAAPKRKGGRPSVFSYALGERICDRIAAGESLREAAKAEGATPSRVLDWVDRFPKFAEQYTHAREQQTQLLEDRLIELCKEAHAAAKDRKNGHARLAAIRIETDTVKWRLAKLMPKRYGNKSAVELTGKDGAPLVPVPDPVVLAELATMQAEAQARIKAAMPEGGGTA